MQLLKHTWERICVGRKTGLSFEALFCVCVCVCNKDSSQFHRRTLANWEGGICCGFDLVVRAIHLFLGLWICETEQLEEKVMLFNHVFSEEFAVQKTNYIFFSILIFL